MSCNGCRVLRKACAADCVLRTCLQWIPVPEAQGNATLFLAKFFGRSDLLALIAAVPESQRAAMFRSLLFEACGRTVNPVNGAVGLLTTGNWQLCEDAVTTVLSGGTLHPLPLTSSTTNAPPPVSAFNTARAQAAALTLRLPNPAINSPAPSRRGKRSHNFAAENRPPMRTASSACSEMSEMVTVESGGCDGGGAKEMKLLNLFV